MNRAILPNRIGRSTSVVLAVLAILVVSGPSTLVFAQDKIKADKDHSIDLATAVQLTKGFQQASLMGELKAEAFGKDAILALLDQPGCVGLRIYFATGDDGGKVLVLVGVDVEGKDMYLGLLDDKGFPCPPLCDETSPLNGK